MKINNLYIGIDPGVTGALVIITNETARFFDCPKTVHGMQDIIERTVLKYKNTHNIFCYMENVHTIEEWSRQNGDKLMRNLGQWEGLLASFNISYELVLPKTWQRYTVIKQHGKDTKYNSKATAKKSFYWCYEGWQEGKPTSAEKLIGSNHNRSDAFLISSFCEKTKGKLCSYKSNRNLYGAIYENE